MKHMIASQKQQQYINPNLCEADATQIRTRYRQLWKKTMNTVPDYGGMWKQYKLIGDDYVNAGFPQDALDYGYGQALELCELGALPGKDGLRKKTKILLKIAEAHTEMGDLKAVIDSLLKAKDAAALIKDANDRIPLQLEIYYQLAVAYNSKGPQGKEKSKQWLNECLTLTEDENWIAKINSLHNDPESQEIPSTLNTTYQVQSTLSNTCQKTSTTVSSHTLCQNTIKLTFSCRGGQETSQTIQTGMLEISANNLSQPISWIVDQATDLYKKKFGVEIASVKRLIDLQLNELDLWDPIRSLTLPNEILIDIEAVKIPPIKTQLEYLLGQASNAVKYEDRTLTLKNLDLNSSNFLNAIERILINVNEDTNNANDDVIALSFRGCNLNERLISETPLFNNSLIGSLTALDLSMNLLNCASINRLCTNLAPLNVNKLEKISLNGNSLRGNFVNFLTQLLKFPNLTELYLNNCGLGESEINDVTSWQLIGDAFKRAKNLLRLEMRSNNLTDATIKNFLLSIGCFQSRLTHLSLSANRFDSCGINEDSAVNQLPCLGRLGRLKRLELSDCNLTDCGLEMICNLVLTRQQELEEIDLSFNCGFSESIRTKLETLTSRIKLVI